MTITLDLTCCCGARMVITAPSTAVPRQEFHEAHAVCRERGPAPEWSSEQLEEFGRQYAERERMAAGVGETAGRAAFTNGDEIRALLDECTNRAGCTADTHLSDCPGMSQ